MNRNSCSHRFRVVTASRIELSRPAEDYRLTITILKASFNQPIEPEKFELKQPEGSELVNLSAAKVEEAPRGQ